MHLRRHARLAACLDSTPLYASHTTGSDCLGEAAPLFTLPSEGWATRVGASLAVAAGTPQTVALSIRGLVEQLAALTVLGREGAGCHRVLGLFSDERQQDGRAAPGASAPASSGVTLSRREILRRAIHLTAKASSGGTDVFTV